MPGSSSIDKRHLLADLAASQPLKWCTHRNGADAHADTDDDGSVADDQPDLVSDPPT